MVRMESISRTLFEDPIYIYVALIMAELIIFAIWRERRTLSVASLLAVPPVIAAVVWLISWAVVTDRERIVEAAQAIADDVVAGTRENLDKFIDDNFLAYVDGMHVDKKGAISILASRGEGLHIVRVEFTRRDVELQGNYGVMKAVTVVFTGPKDKSPIRTPISWRLKWVKRDDVWRLMSADPPQIGIE